MPFTTLSPEWNVILKPEFDKPYYTALSDSVNAAYKSHTIFPPNNLVFNALNLCPFNNIKVVIIGQDPYHRPGQANGLSFSVNDGIKIPPSLKNIFKELATDIPGFEIPAYGNLEAWQNKVCFC